MSDFLVERSRAVLRDVLDAHAELLRCVEEGRVFRMAPFLRERRKSHGSVPRAFAIRFGCSSKVLFDSKRAGLAPVERGRTHPATIAEHAEALRLHIEKSVAEGRQFKLGAITAFLVARGVKCNASVQDVFAKRYTTRPYEYYLDTVAKRALELQATLPRVKRAWLILRTGATEKAFGNALVRADRAAAERDKAA